jgi:hypothetical protein
MNFFNFILSLTQVKKFLYDLAYSLTAALSKHVLEAMIFPPEINT